MLIKFIKTLVKNKLFNNQFLKILPLQVFNSKISLNLKYREKITHQINLHTLNHLTIQKLLLLLKKCLPLHKMLILNHCRGREKSLLENPCIDKL